MREGPSRQVDSCITRIVQLNERIRGIALGSGTKGELIDLDCAGAAYFFGDGFSLLHPVCGPSGLANDIAIEGRRPRSYREGCAHALPRLDRFRKRLLCCRGSGNDRFPTGGQSDTQFDAFGRRCRCVLKRKGGFLRAAGRECLEAWRGIQGGLDIILPELRYEEVHGQGVYAITSIHLGPAVGKAGDLTS